MDIKRIIELCRAYDEQMAELRRQLDGQALSREAMLMADHLIRQTLMTPLLTELNPPAPQLPTERPLQRKT